MVPGLPIESPSGGGLNPVSGTTEGKSLAALGRHAVKWAPDQVDQPNGGWIRG